MPASSKLDKDHSMDSIILKLVGVGLVAFELYNAVSITAITICSAKTFGKIHEQGTPLSGASLYTLLVAGSGMLMWVLLISRILTWRWTGWSQYRLKRAGSLVVGIITFWAVSIIILQQRQLNIQVDSLVKDLVLTNTVGASILFLCCILVHTSIFLWTQPLCSALRELAPSFGMFYEDVGLVVVMEDL